MNTSMEKVGDLALIGTVMTAIVLIYITIQTNGALVQKFPASIPYVYVDQWYLCGETKTPQMVCRESKVTEATFLGASHTLEKMPQGDSSEICAHTPEKGRCETIRIWYK